MRDKISLERLDLIHPKLRDEAKEIYEEICKLLTGRAMCRIAYTLRTYAEQDALYAQGRTKLKDEKGNKLSVVTNAKGGQSYHNFGLAIDIVLLKDTDGNGTFETASWETNVDFDGDGVHDWQECVNVFKRYGWICGIDWKFRDAPHFEKSFGLSVVELNNRFVNKKLITGTNYVQI